MTALPALLAASVLAAPTRIGAAGAVSGGVSAAAPEAPRRALKSGGQVFHKDAVSTDEKGRLQVLLLDQTVFTVGPRSEVVMDEFVYDPFTDSGKITAQVTKGVFRLVTGNVARKRTDRVNIKTPSGTIGIRGTIAGGSVQGDETLVGLMGPGKDNDADERQGVVEVSNEHGSVTLDEPGTGTRVGPDGPPSPPFTLSSSDLDSLDAGGDEAGAGSGEDSEGAGSGDASEESGAETAEGRGNASDASEVEQTAGETEETSSFASQDAAAGIADGLARWDDVRTIPSGQAHYNGSGAWDLTTCNNGSCANNQSGSMSFQMNIDFGARTYGGGGSSIFASDTDSNAFGGSPFSASITINSESFAALTGNARITGSAGACSMVVDLMNVNGQAAHQAQATMTLNDGTNAGTGTITAPRFDGLIPQ